MKNLVLHCSFKSADFNNYEKTCSFEEEAGFNCIADSFVDTSIEAEREGSIFLGSVAIVGCISTQEREFQWTLDQGCNM